MTRPIVAVVEDNDDNRMLVRAMIGELYEVVEYATGAEAAEAIPANPPDLVLMDVSLPGMDGRAVTAALRAAGLTDLPIVALTAHAMVGDREDLLASGFDGYVSKPVLEVEDLLEPIARLLARDQS